MSLVRFRPKAPFAGLAHLVERHLAKVEVASSSLVTRSKDRPNGLVFFHIIDFVEICGFSSSGRAPPSQGGCGEFESRNPLQNKTVQDIAFLDCLIFILKQKKGPAFQKGGVHKKVNRHSGFAVPALVGFHFS